MPVQAGGIKTIIRRQLIARLAGRQPSVDLSALDMLTCAALSGHLTHPLASAAQPWWQGRPSVHLRGNGKAGVNRGKIVAPRLFG